MSKNFRIVVRPSWKKKERYLKINLSRNVHYDDFIYKKTNQILKSNKKNILHYADPYGVYESISKYYKIPLNKLTVGFGATDLLNRLTKVLDVDKFYVVKPTFEAFPVYCEINSKKYRYIKNSEVYKKRKKSCVYLVNPNGIDGSVYKINPKIFRLYKYVIIDEVYSDFSPKFSLLNKNIKNLIIVKSLSKSIGLAGIRVGFCKASDLITKKIQSVRLSQVCSSYASIIVPKIIKETKHVVKRMNDSKKYIEKKYECKKSNSNYVLFKNKNNLIKKFGARKVLGFYRMALTNIRRIKNNE